MCNCCRLAKCFRLGMKKELILSEEEKEERRQRIQENRQRKSRKHQKSTALELVKREKNVFFPSIKIYFISLFRFNQHVYFQ